jgi:Glycoside hydrolase family 44/Bacterial Ig-like domain (group 3)
MRFDVGTWCVTLICACLGVGVAAYGQSAPPALSVDVSSGRHSISSEIYGIASYGLDAAYAKQIAVPNIRWGGDGTTRYNWQVDSSNSGFDWYFMGGSGVTNPTPSASTDLMIRTYAPANALITIPIIPYVNKSAAWSCSFPVSVYGAQQSTNPYVHPNSDNCGNSIATNGTQLVDNNIYANHIDNSTGLQKGWLQHLIGTFGPASKGGVAFYQLDNEPYGWSNTHRDVLPNGANYPTITQLGEQYAAAIKQVDPSAMVLGPSDFTLGGWVGDTSKQNGLLAAEYYLQQMAAYDAQHGVRILDYLDEHYYFDVSSPSAQLASTRTLWDPTYNGGTWVEQWVFDGPMQLIPRFKGWVTQYYPNTKISLSEYSIDSGNKSIVDAVAEMDVLGIFGREQLDFANMWSAPAPTDPIAYSFRMYRNYDGNGGQYGDTWVNATSSDQNQLSVYAAQRSTDNAVTILVLNKTTGAISTSLSLAGTTLPSTAAVYSYNGANLQQIAQGTAVSIDSGAISYSFPGYSGTLFVFTPAATPVASTTTLLTASPTQGTAGQGVVLTATVSGAGSPTGIVTFMDGAVSIGSGTLSGGKASLTISAMRAGSHVITAAYSGDSGDAASASGPVTVILTQPAPASTTTTLAASETQLTFGQNLTLTAAVSSTNGTPAGTVTLGDGGAVLGSVSLVNGAASFSYSSLALGNHSIVASYAGDATHEASSSVAVSVVVTQAAAPAPVSSTTTTSLNASASQLTAGQSLTLTAAVTSSSGVATGTVTFSDGVNSLGAVPLLNGIATITSTLNAGSHSIIAAYSGDASDGPSTSPAVTVTVANAASPAPPAPQDFSLQLAQTTMSLAPGNSGQIELTVTPQNGFNQQLKLSCSGLPAGATCSFSPSTLTPATAMTSSMTITMAPSSAVGMFLLPFSGAFLLLRRRRSRMGALFAVMGLMLLAGCGAGVTSQVIGPTTGAGPAVATYAIQVSAVAAGGQSHTQQITLTVQ